MAGDDKAKLQEKSERQKDKLEKANPGADVKVDNRKDGHVEVNEVRVSTEGRS